MSENGIDEMRVSEILERVESYRDLMVKTLCDLIRIKAISPDSGGEGEFDKAEYLMNLLDCFEVERFDAPDSRAKGGIRPNIVARLEGRRKRTIWIVTHIDVVPEGDVRLWHTPPFEPVVKDGRIYGRGSEDNGQPLVSSLFAAKAIADSGIKPEYTLCLAFVSDEETGSRYGIQHLLEQDLFGRNDMFVVPDAGSSDGSMIEIAEKSILWLKFVVHGRQAHASMPHIAVNASREAMRFIIDLDEELHRRFDGRNDLFQPPHSTFEPTKREANVDNVNTIPGLDVSYMDCRILPEYDINDVLAVVEDVRRKHEERGNGKIEVEVVQKESSPPTPEDSEVVKLLSKAIELARGVKPAVFGIGGNTCAAFFRKAGYPTAVWSTVDGVAHQPNEYAVIENMVADAKVFALMPFLKV
ncbi:M20 family metallo-hydrolase [Archaeoglobus veneficus]|uniref:Acetylornithine deacetylase or succinyl-diaminopimelate desuccinylase n=1 Tax=Archaeoglobus veneficus (strain DSM 11195 / SNP6) TaxID=693661 RepID=F2KTC3_ARCVS|nr:M20 family metallo-hydrolase [Archaeoglobus veneficus]AEA47153.1 acetylornithine deacetylase or succinyl-diaminopimelate desuccinylase [Archaeoglobus veneficus SNP6]